MKLTLRPDWKKILRYAWSSRLMALAIILTGVDALFTFFGVNWLPVPQWTKMLLVMLVTGLAFYVRILAQKEFKGAD